MVHNLSIHCLCRLSYFLLSFSDNNQAGDNEFYINTFRFMLNSDKK